MTRNRPLMNIISSILTVATIAGCLALFRTKVSAASTMPSAGDPIMNVVDISQWNDMVSTASDDIDFTLLKTQVDAVYIRAFGHDESGIYIDHQAVNYAHSAQDVNLIYGFYFYYIPKKNDAEDAKAQARAFYEFVRNYAYSCVPVLDVEYNPPEFDENGQIDPDHLTKEQLASAVQTFADEFKALSGFDLMIYSYPYFIKNNFDQTFSWDQYKLWIAHYDVPAPMYGISSTWMPESLWCWSRWDMWQYTSKGTLSSIPNSAPGHLDMSQATDNILLSTPTAVTAVDWPSTTSINGGDITLSGWALSHSGTKRIDVYSEDDIWLGSTEDMFERADVQALINSNGRYNDGLHSGFALTLDAEFFSIGQNTVKIKVTNRNDTETWSSHTFTYGEVAYQSHVQDLGWQDWAHDGGASGTSGQSKRLEAMSIILLGIDGGIEYRTHVQDIGWMPWVADGAITGTSGQGKRLEAIQIRLTDEAAEKYDVYYRVHAENVGWMGWAKNGESSGTAGYGYRLEAIEIVLSEKGEAAPGSTANSYADFYTLPIVSYQTHIQDVGWQSSVINGATSGTSGQSKRLEAIRMQLEHLDGGIEYKTHVQDVGWMNWVSDGSLSGTSGESKRLEAIQIQLTGDTEALYDIYYRVHAQEFGWLDWAKNGDPAGTAGYSYRLEAIQVVLVPKNGSPPGATAQPFRKAE
ncbi:MAG: GH25 family lysozyme [Oscillospiraceae bacterium]|nr:GH25 family lysozyme [Oscillospiraceae bacterium]